MKTNRSHWFRAWNLYSTQTLHVLCIMRFDPVSPESATMMWETAIWGFLALSVKFIPGYVVDMINHYSSYRTLLNNCYELKMLNFYELKRPNFFELKRLNFYELIYSAICFLNISVFLKYNILSYNGILLPIYMSPKNNKNRKFVNFLGNL